MFFFPGPSPTDLLEGWIALPSDTELSGLKPLQTDIVGVGLEKSIDADTPLVVIVVKREGLAL